MKLTSLKQSRMLRKDAVTSCPVCELVLHLQPARVHNCPSCAGSDVAKCDSQRRWPLWIETNGFIIRNILLPVVPRGYFRLTHPYVVVNVFPRMAITCYTKQLADKSFNGLTVNCMPIKAICRRVRQVAKRDCWQCVRSVTIFWTWFLWTCGSSWFNLCLSMNSSYLLSCSLYFAVSTVLRLWAGRT